MERDEITLIRAAQDGDQTAVIALYEQHRDTVYTYVYHRVGRLPDAAEDITADVFVRMVSKLHTFKVKDKPLLAWLYSIAHNLVIDYYRTVDKQNESPLTPSLQTGGMAVEAQVAHRIETEQVRSAMDGLTDPQRDVLICRFMNGLSVRETADMMERQEGAIKTLTRRAIAAVQRQLRPEVRYGQQ